MDHSTFHAHTDVANIFSGTCPCGSMRIFDHQSEPYTAFKYFHPQQMEKDKGILQYVF